MLKTNQDTGILILRLTVGILMLFHGLAKLSGGVEGIQDLLASKGLPGFLAYGLYVGEVIAPLLLIIGFRTRLAALILTFTMLVALLLVHSADIFKLTPHGGWAIELIAFFIFGAVALFFTGGGRYALSTTNKWD